VGVLLVMAGCAGSSVTASVPEIERPSGASPGVNDVSEVKATQAEHQEPVPPPKTVLDLKDVTNNPRRYEWFNFKPNLDKLILSGTPDTQHVALLWYTVPDGKVGLHYHSQTESVYVIDGSQTDEKGVYPTGTVYFNPPGSGHQIKDSTGFFILAYASPPDFKNTGLIGQYTSVRVDTLATDLVNNHPFQELAPGARMFPFPLQPEGGMNAALLALEGRGTQQRYQGNYVLVLKGKCHVDGQTLVEQNLAVAKGVAPEPFVLATIGAEPCLVLAVAFEPALKP
jgi:hypothetical protein